METISLKSGHLHPSFLKSYQNTHGALGRGMQDGVFRENGSSSLKLPEFDGSFVVDCIRDTTEPTIAILP